MNKKEIAVGCVILVAVGLCFSVANARPSKRLDPATKQCRIFNVDAEWWGAGNEIFQQKCKTCHVRGNDKGAPFLHSESKTSKAWNRVFFAKYPKCAQDGSWDITLEEQLVLNDFLYKYASDTYNAYSAEDCG